MIISRYLIKEVLIALVAVTLVLIFILFCDQTIRLLNYAATGKFAANILLTLMGFEIPYLLALLLPLGLYLGIILAYGRLYADNEMGAIMAGGYSARQLLFLTCGISFLVSVFVMVLMLWINPAILAQKNQLILRSVSAENVFSTVMPGRFQTLNDGKRVIYIESLTRNRQHANNIFVAELQPAGHPWVVLSAAHGGQEKDPVTKERFMVATDGFRYLGVPGQNDYQIIQFKKYAVHIPSIIETARYQAEEGMTSFNLWQHYQRSENAAELQWRLSIGISAFLLGLLAVPLSRLRPRQGRYAAIFPAVLIYLVYVNLLFIARDWVGAKFISISLGMWWVHGLFLLIALLLVTVSSSRNLSAGSRGHRRTRAKTLDAADKPRGDGY